ncbi:MAG TPA: hypothetical protein VII47_05730 [Actinomycetota bacterium]|jgi:hypothetical protein
MIVDTMEEALQDNVQKMLEELEALRRVVESPDDSWMDALSQEELVQLRQRALLLADSLSKIRDQLDPHRE